MHFIKTGSRGSPRNRRVGVHHTTYKQNDDEHHIRCKKVYKFIDGSSHGSAIGDIRQE